MHNFVNINYRIEILVYFMHNYLLNNSFKIRENLPSHFWKTVYAVGKIRNLVKSILKMNVSHAI